MEHVLRGSWSMCHNIQGVENMKSLISSPFALFLYSCSVLYIEYTIKVLASQSDEHMTSNNTCPRFLINTNPLVKLNCLQTPFLLKTIILDEKGKVKIRMGNDSKRTLIRSMISVAQRIKIVSWHAVLFDRHQMAS